MLQINIKLYGELKTYTPGDHTEFKMMIEPGACLEDILKAIAIPHDRFVTLINGRRWKKTDKFVQGDTLVFLPEISGG
ncbi:MAG: MoaD/ThiS family protein [Desulfobacula sp.]|nr:MoaD/ThiS family protein [Desulfobacula sp.]